MICQTGIEVFALLEKKPHAHRPRKRGGWASSFLGTLALRFMKINDLELRGRMQVCVTRRSYEPRVRDDDVVN